MLNHIQKAIIYKDTKEIFQNKQVIIPMFIVPLILMMILPIALFIAVAYIPADVSDISQIIKNSC